MADPSKPADDEVNRPDTQFRARMSVEFHRAIENWIDDNGLSKKEAAEYAFRLAMSQPFDRSIIDGPKV